VHSATELLSLIAELGLGFAGFLAIFLIFARRESGFSPADGLRVRGIVYASFVAIFMALLPLILMQVELGEITMWRASSVVFLLVGIFVCASIGRAQLSMSPDERAGLGILNNVVTWGMSALVLVLLGANAVGGFGEPSAPPYLTALVLSLAVATSNFVTIAIQRLL
jgi:hypothetical protein